MQVYYYFSVLILLKSTVHFWIMPSFGANLWLSQFDDKNICHYSKRAHHAASCVRDKDATTVPGTQQDTCGREDILNWCFSDLSDYLNSLNSSFAHFKKISSIYDFRYSRQFLRALCHLLPDTFAVLETISPWRSVVHLSFLFPGLFL